MSIIKSFTLFFFGLTFLWAAGNYIAIRDVYLSWPVFIVNFVLAAGATANIILLASRDTLTLSLMALELSFGAIANREAASIVSISARCAR